MLWCNKKYKKRRKTFKSLNWIIRRCLTSYWPNRARDARSWDARVIKIKRESNKDHLKMSKLAVISISQIMVIKLLLCELSPKSKYKNENHQDLLAQAQRCFHRMDCF